MTFTAVMVLLLHALLSAGVARYHLGIRRGREMPYATLLDGFGAAGRVIGLALLEAALISLWLLLLIIPGIVAAYRYRFALYNLLEHPDISPMEAIAMSRAQTAGCKGELFLLDLSFLGWFLLSALTLGLLDIWLQPYYVQTNVGYYRAVCAAKGMDAPAREDREDPGPCDPSL